MDRFIAFTEINVTFVELYLKSNMDRFIAGQKKLNLQQVLNLKSNMDRFIGLRSTPDFLFSSLFKIQYG